MDDWPDLTEAELRATALERLDLHYEHRDALAVERGSWHLADHLRRFAALRVHVAGTVIDGRVRGVGADWVELGGAVVRLDCCSLIESAGRVDPVSRSPLGVRQVLRQMAGRVPREIVAADGTRVMGAIEWVGADFLHLRVEGRAAVMPLAQAAAVLSGVGLAGGD
jgi:hypothetical protein